MPLAGRAKIDRQRERRAEQRAAKEAERAAALEAIDRDPVASSWSRRNWRLPDENREWDPPKFQVELLDLCCGEESHPKLVALRKPSQVGFTNVLALLMVHCAAARDLRAAMVMPTDTMARRFAQKHLDTAMRDCEPFAVSVEGLPKLRRSSRYLILPRKGVLRVGAANPADLRMWTTDLLVVDECDGWKIDVNTEGDILGLARRANRNSLFPRTIIGSTPGVKGQSAIDDAVSTSDVVYEYWTVCPDCGIPAPQRWENLRWPDEGTPRERAEVAQYECPHCGYWRTWAEHPAAIEDDAAGWKDRDGNGIFDGEIAERVAFDCDASLSVWAPWSDSVRDWLEAQKNPDKLRRCVNTLLGQSWAVEEEYLESDALLRSRVSLDPLPAEVEMICLTVDVQGTVGGWLACGVFGWTRDRRCYYIERMDFAGVVDRADGDAWRMLYDWLGERPAWLREDDRRLPIHQIALDSGYQAQAVYVAARRLAGMKYRAEAIKGVGGWDVPVHKARYTTTKLRTGGQVRMWAVGVDSAKQAVVRMARKGELVLSAKLSDDHTVELAAEVLERKRERGKHVAKWVQVDERNESLDLAVYALWASMHRMPAWWRG